MTVDELLAACPLPWRITGDAGDIHDANQEYVCLEPVSAQAICDAMSELARLREENAALKLVTKHAPAMERLAAIEARELATEANEDAALEELRAYKLRVERGETT